MKAKAPKLEALRIIEIFIIFLFWLISIKVSEPILNYPMDWLSSHTLSSMRAFEEWGFWKLLGASILVPSTPEFQNIDITSLTKYEGVYLSYPSLWLVLPYITLKILSPFGVQISPISLEVYNLVTGRLFLSIVLYFIFLEVINLASVDARLGGLVKRIIAFTTTLCWMFSTPVLYWTQNEYFSDQAVLLPIYLITLLLLKRRFSLISSSLSLRSVLGVLVFWGCSIDWYAWVATLILFGIVWANDFSEKKSSTKDFIFQYPNVLFPVFLGVLITLGIYLVQLLYFKDGFSQLLAIFIQRTSTQADTGKTLSFLDLLTGIYSHWLPYIPEAKKLKFIILPLVLASSIFLYSSVPQPVRKNIGLLIAAIIVVPLVQLLLLKQHSYTHTFSAFKMALPVSFFLYLIPLMSMTILASEITSSFSSNAFNCTVLAISSFLVVSVISYSSYKILDFAGPSSPRDQQLEKLVSSKFSINHLLFSTNLRVSAFPPDPFWYTHRFIYAPYGKIFQDLKPKLNQNVLEKMEVTYFDFKFPRTGEKLTTESIARVCRDQWNDSPYLIEGREIIFCQGEALTKLLR
jgi:hypothetical protein